MDEAKLKIEKLSDGAVTCLRLEGTIDESFDGKKLAATVKGETLVLDLGGVRKISSFGIREWVDFVGGAGERVQSLILVECSPKVVDQLNMVMNFAGKGLVFSFYAPYRCDYCDIERRVLLQVDRDAEAIRTLAPPERPCETCGNPSYFDDDPASFFSYLGAQPRFELDPQVAAFLSAKLAYSVSDAARRFRAEKHIEGRLTFLRVSGDLDAAFPAEKVAEGLEGQVVIDLGGAGKIDPAGAAAWRGFMATLSTTCEQVWLVAVPPVFLERLTRAEDLGRAQVLSLTMPYTCSKCSATASHPIDVEQHFDVLKFATPPEARCPDCGSPAVCAASEALLAHLGALSRPTVPPETRKLIAVERERKPAPRLAPAATAPPPRRALGTVLLASAAAAVVAVAVVLGIGWLRPGAAVTGDEGPGELVARSAAQRPAWIGSDRPGYARCTDAPGEGISCAGASTYAASVEAARAEASAAALDALLERVGMGIENADWKRLVASHYGPARQRTLAGPPADAAAARRAVADALRATAPVVLAQPAAEYSERYRAPGGERILTFVRYDVAPSEIDALRARYTATTEVLGARAWTVFPALAWRAGSLRGGAQLVAVGDGPLRAAGLAPQDIILEVEGRPIATAEAFAAALATEHERLARTGGALSLLVKSGDAEPRAFNVAVARVEAPAARPIRTGTPAAPPGGGVNVWDRTGGGQSRDDPNQ